MSTETIEVLKTIIADRKPVLAAECLAFVAGLKRAGMSDIAARHHISRQAVSKRIQAFRALIP